MLFRGGARVVAGEHAHVDDDRLRRRRPRRRPPRSVPASSPRTRTGPNPRSPSERASAGEVGIGVADPLADPAVLDRPRARARATRSWWISSLR